jgi:hypothetical protein
MATAPLQSNQTSSLLEKGIGGLPFYTEAKRAVLPTPTSTSPSGTPFYNPETFSFQVKSQRKNSKTRRNRKTRKNRKQSRKTRKH